MKKCPNCHAEIDDNARFCVFCMSPLEEKTTISSQKNPNKIWLYAAAVFLLVVLILLVLFFTIWKNDNNDDNNSAQDKIIASSNSTDSNTETEISNNAGENSSNDDGDLMLTPPENGDNNEYESDDDTDSDNDDFSTTSSDPVTSSHPNTPSKPSEPDEPTVSTITPSVPNTPSQNENENENNNDNSTSSDDSANTQTPTTVEKPSYKYRDALYTECYMYGNNPQQLMENHIVITGVSGVTSNGVYEIPETIDGKRVVAVMQSAFSNPEVSPYVKKVVLPTYVRSVWENAFSDCYNLTDIYFITKNVSISELAFANIENRTGTLTIHCTKDCKDAQYKYYKTISNSKFGAVYKEWNGGEIK